MIYEVPPHEYLDRQRRMLRARGKVDGHLDPDAITRILAEVAPLELMPGTRYRFQVLGGKPSFAPFHAVEVASGRHVVGQLPDVLEPEWLEVEGLYLGRGPKDSPYHNNLLFHLGDGQLAALADMDILRLGAIDDRRAST